MQHRIISSSLKAPCNSSGIRWSVESRGTFTTWVTWVFFSLKAAIRKLICLKPGQPPFEAAILVNLWCEILLQKVWKAILHSRVSCFDVPTKMRKRQSDGVSSILSSMNEIKRLVDFQIISTILFVACSGNIDLCLLVPCLPCSLNYWHHLVYWGS